jgi:hypothetical protein
MCRIYRILFTLLPIRKLRSALIRRHFERCPRCAANHEIPDEILVSLKPPWLETTPSLWPPVRRLINAREDALEKIRPKSHPLRIRVPRWAVAAAGVLLSLAALAYFMWLKHPAGSTALEASKEEERSAVIPRVLVKSVELKGKPAKSYIFQTPKASFVWIAPSKGSGG